MTEPHTAQDFTPDGYAALVAAFLERGYAVTGFDDADPSAAYLILRHDLDMSIQAAVRLADIEAGLGVAGVYFVLLRTEMYNPWSKANRIDLRLIASMGHEIGLHLDASLYADDDEALEAAADAECTILESIIDAPVRTISFHRPAKGLQGRSGALAGRRHAYEPRFFNDMGYCSDSRGGWHHGHPLDHPAAVAGRALQLLTHPIWWSGPGNAERNGDGPVATLDRFRRDRDVVLARALSANCEPYRAARGPNPGPLPAASD